MGYTTDFAGQINIEPPLNAAEIKYLKAFNESRRMDREYGPYFVGGSGYMGGNDTDKIYDHNRPHPSQPGLWCQWTVTEDGTAIVWDGGEKFYHSEKWMHYIITHFLSSTALAKQEEANWFKDFTFNHVCNGTIHAVGKDDGDVWDLVVKDNKLV